MKLKKFDLLLIEWQDACSKDLGWINLEDYNPTEMKAEGLAITVGYLIEEDKESIHLVHTIGKAKDCGILYMMIPKGCILSIKKIGI